MKKSRVIIIVVICVALLVGGYVFWMNRNGNASSEEVELTKVQQLITKDLTKNYPETPREVVKTYNEIITCFYNEEYTEEELEALVDQTLLLMDEELAANNPKADYFKAVKAEIADFAEAERTIVSYTLPSSNDVLYRTVDDRECAYVETSYFIKEKTSYSKTYQTYVVRKDDNGDWKILVFYKNEGDTSDGE
ncbi:MAG: hypothetical protein IJZ23_11760 [Roseburia sp.]|nr:hypothetical protein [Roseburia sp.]